MGRPALHGRALLALAALALALVLVPSGAGASAPVVTATRSVVGLDDTLAGGFEPPDVQVAAGPGFVVETANLGERVWRTEGRAPQVVQTRRLEAFFGTADRLTDPRILFDAPSGRWFASISNVDKGTVLLAVSSGSDPTEPWTVASFAAGGCADQPRLGVADGLVVLGADVYGDCGEDNAPMLGSELWIVSKEQLLAGSAAPAFTTYGPTGAYSSLAPAQSLSSTSTAYVVSVDRPASRVVHLLEVSGVPPGDVQVHEVATPAVDPLLRPPAAAQPQARGVEPPLSTNDDRVLDSVWENGRLWLTANGRCSSVGDPIIHACARVVELSTATRTVSWETDIQAPGAHVFFPAARPDGQGNLVIVAGESGTKVPPELIAVGRTPDGTLTAPVVLARSPGPYRGDRYGDYFGAARDPVDPSAVWVAGEAGADVAGGEGWSTFVASLVVTGPGVTPPAVASVPPPGVRASSEIVRVGGAVRLAYRALADGSDVRTVVSVRSPASAVVFRTTTPASTLRAGRRYVVVWPAPKARGPFDYCASTLSQAGLRSSPSCTRITLR